MTLSITKLCHYAERHYAECHVLFTIMLSVVMLSVIMLNVAVPRKIISQSKSDEQISDINVF